MHLSGNELRSRIRLYFFYPLVTASWATDYSRIRKRPLPEIRFSVDPGKHPGQLRPSRRRSFQGILGPTREVEPPDEQAAKDGNRFVLGPASYIPLVHAWCGEDSQRDKVWIDGEVVFTRRSHTNAEARFPVRLYYSCDILQSGAGCAVLRLDFKDMKRAFSQDEIIQLTNLGESDYEGVQLQLYDRKDDLYRVSKTFSQAFISALSETMKRDKRYSSLDPKGLTWLDWEMYLGSHGDADRKPHLNPGVLTVLYDPKGYDEWRHFRLHANALKPFGSAAVVEQALPALLFRSHRPESVDPSFVNSCLRPRGERLPNMLPTADYFVHFHLRSCLAIARAETDAIALMSEPLLKETLKLLRMRWYHLVVSEMRLDEAIAGACLSLLTPDLGSERTGSKGDAKWQTPITEDEVRSEHKARREFRKRVLLARAATLRAFQDPITYRIGSGSLIEFYEQAAEKLKISELEQNLDRKLNSLALLYEDIIEHWRRGETELLLNEWERLWREREARTI